jgi:hypothetical protein
MPAAYKGIPTQSLWFKSDRERPIRAKPVHECCSHLDLRQRASEEDITSLTRWTGGRDWFGYRLVGFVLALSYGQLSDYVEGVVIHARCRRTAVEDRSMSRSLQEVGDVDALILLRETIPLTSRVKMAAEVSA